MWLAKERGNGELLVHGHRVSVLQDKKCSENGQLLWTDKRPQKPHALDRPRVVMNTSGGRAQGDEAGEGRPGREQGAPFPPLFASQAP